MIALCIAMRLSSTIPDKDFKHTLNNLLEKIFDTSTSKKLKIEDVLEKISLKNIEYYKIDKTIFQQIINSLIEEQPIEITYYSLHKKEETKRTIKPLHLLCYMGRWHLIAYCDNKKDIRDFALSRVKSIKKSSKKISVNEKMLEIKTYLRQSFGLFAGDNQSEVCLKFSQDISDWIKEQIWHEAQEITENEDAVVEIPQRMSLTHYLIMLMVYFIQ